MKFKEIYPNFEVFKVKIVDPIQLDYPDSEWCDYDKMLTSWEAIYNAMFRMYNWRQARYKAFQIHNNFINTFIEELPSFYLKQKAFLTNNLVNFSDLKTLGSNDQLTRNLKNMMKSSGTIDSSNKSIISPQGFINTIDDSVASQVNKDTITTKNDNSSDIENTGTETTNRVDILEKFIKLLNTDYRYKLKDLILKFQNNFQRFQTILENGDEDVYIKLKSILKENDNIDYIFDDKTSTIKIDLKGVDNLRNVLTTISEEIDKKIDLDFNNAEVEKLVSKEPNNQIKVDNNKLYVKSGGGETYSGDNTSVKINDKNVISTYGVHYTDDKHQEKVLTGNKIVDNTQKINENISNNKTKIDINTNNIAANKTIIDGKFDASSFDNKSIVKAPSTNKYYCEALSEPGTQKYVGIEDINKTIDDKIKEAISKIILPKWKIVLKPEDFITENKEKNFKYNFKKDSLYYLVAIGFPGYAFQKFFYTLNKHESLYCTLCPTIEVKPITIFIILFNVGNGNYNLSLTDDNSIDKWKFYLYELENSIEPLPVPPSPVLNKEKEYNFFKRHLKIGGE